MAAGRVGRAGRIRAAWLVAAVLLPAVPACAQRSDHPRPPRPLVVRNRAHQPINQLYLSPADATQWGEDRLGDHALPPGQSVRIDFSAERGCLFDVQAVYDDASREERHRLDLCRTADLVLDGSGAQPAPPPTPHDITLINRDARPIQQAFVSAAAAPDWGDDRLAHRTLSVGAAVTILYEGECMADLRVVFDNASAEERRAIDVCAHPRIAVAPGWDTADTLPDAAEAPAETPVLVSVRNRTGRAVTSLFLYPAEAGQPGPDLLGGTPLADGAAMAFRLTRPEADCRFAARLVFAGGGTAALAGLDPCRTGTLTLMP